ncbi:MAG: PAS domain-containing sensor histidine kinase, partial [Phycisphaerae bacterium]|nr:PAS domain-containing sensor histidine kinase [Phycisphaerae bacterium]
AALVLIWTGGMSRQAEVVLTLLVTVPWLAFAFSVRSKVAYLLRTLANLMEALREGDYSMRLRGASPGDALGELILEVNQLTRSLQDRRFSAIEATALLRKTLGQIDVAMFGFDQQGCLCLINDSGQAALGKPEKDLMGQTAAVLGLAQCLEGDTPRILELALPAGMRRWELRRTTYRDKGVTHQMVFLSDLTRTLHQEERLAWKRLIQILRHELNNSLTPIQSVAQTLQQRVKQDLSEDQWLEDVRDGLDIIAARSEELGRFIDAYSTLTRLPEPVLTPFDVGPWIQQVAQLETRVQVLVEPGPDLTIHADRAQLDQLLINLVANAAEAALESHDKTESQVAITWHTKDKAVQVLVKDNGPGLDQTRDVFVPFFTTKPQGCGIGLALSRQIAEAHQGYLTLENRSDGPGCVAGLWLSLS